MCSGFCCLNSAVSFQEKEIIKNIDKGKSSKMQNIKNNIAGLIAEKSGLNAKELCDMLEYPPDSSMGDISLPCFKLAKSMRKAPPVIAASLADGFDCPYIKKCETAGGYLNFFIDNDYYSDNLIDKILTDKEKYGSNESGQGKTVVIDYSSPNVAKPFHIGHLGTTVIGHSLRLLFEFSGWKVIGVNHLGDWGTSFGKQIVAYRKWGSKEQIEREGVDGLVSLYVRFHEEAEKDPSLFDEARAEFTKLENGDPEDTELWKWFIDISLTEYKKTYSQLGIAFDYYTGESFYTDKMPAQVERLRDRGLLKLDDGASIVDLEEYNMPPCLILKRDGSTLYPTRDISAAVYRHDTFNFDRAVYVTSSGQSLHFAQWFKVVELMGYDWADKLVHVPYGTMSLNGAKLGTRSGNVVWLKQLLQMSVDKVREIMDEKNPDMLDKDVVAEQVGVGAIVFNYLSNGRIKDISFDLEDALNFDGNTGPYVQYTYARTCSILEKAGNLSGYKGGKITADQERVLCRLLSEYGERVVSALESYEPSVITRYIYEVASAFNRFYHECPVLSADDPEVKAFRVRLIAAAKTVLGSAMHLICMKTPEKI